MSPGDGRRSTGLPATAELGKPCGQRRDRNVPGLLTPVNIEAASLAEPRDRSGVADNAVAATPARHTARITALSDGSCRCVRPRSSGLTALSP